jgi:hypothetical protein
MAKAAGHGYSPLPKATAPIFDSTENPDTSKTRFAAIRFF